MKKTKKINEKRLAAYTAAASAVLVAAAPVNAEIHYTPADVLLSNDNYALDMDGDSNPEFNFWASWTAVYSPGSPGYPSYPGSGFMHASGVISSAAPGAFWLADGGGPLVQNLANGAPIFGAATNWDNYYGYLFAASMSSMYYQGTGTGNFGPYGYGPGSGYIGVKFNPDGTDLYGWIHVDNVEYDLSSYHIDGWAYEDNGASILAGEIPAVVPEPSSMVLFAAGAAGLAIFRKRKKK